MAASRFPTVQAEIQAKGIAMDVLRSFVEKIEIVNDCWQWTAATNLSGYGRFYDGDRLVLPHRWSYEFHCGEIPNGMVIDHLCRNRLCCNPAHLEVVSPLENTTRGLTGKLNNHNSRKTHCPRGHEYNSTNTYINKRGGRICRTCNRERSTEKT